MQIATTASVVGSSVIDFPIEQRERLAHAYVGEC